LQAKRAAIFARASVHPYAAYMAVLGMDERPPNES